MTMQLQLQEKEKPLTIMVASSVYGFEDNIVQICATLSGYGYRVLNSHIGTIPNNPNRTNLEDCLAAVDECDIFFGVIRPFYGTGKVGERSITHEEMLRAVNLKKPRWFMAHRDVTFARQVFKQYMYNRQGVRKKFRFKKTGVLDDLRVIDLYNDVVQNELPVNDRKGYWIQEFYKGDEILNYLEVQFGDIERIREISKEMNA
jgi:hypothetical protein